MLVVGDRLVLSAALGQLVRADCSNVRSRFARSNRSFAICIPSHPSTRSHLLVSCPFDYIKVYDGSSVDDPLIDTYCGQQRNLVVYSSGEDLLVQFTTLQRTADTQNRGFAGWFEFSERFVNLGMCVI